MTINEKLFRLTRKRKIILEDITQWIRHEIESMDASSLRRAFILENEKTTKEEKQAKLMELDIKLKTLHLHHDVLKTVLWHTEDWNRANSMKEKREWITEWDIPLPIFQDSIDETIQLLTSYEEKGMPTYRSSYEEQKVFLHALKAFRE